MGRGGKTDPLETLAKLKEVSHTSASNSQFTHARSHAHIRMIPGVSLCRLAQSPIVLVTVGKGGELRKLCRNKRDYDTLVVMLCILEKYAQM
jgi:hypothetical protein